MAALKAIKNEKGMTLIEVVVGMVVFAVGILMLGQVLFGSMRANTNSRNTVVATNLAHQRMEQILASTRYSAITAANFPTEDYGQIENNNQDFQVFRRVVSVVDSTNALGTSVLKDVTVRVEWRSSTGTREVELRSSIARFKDINL